MFEKPSRAVDRVFLHCSASDNASHDNIETMREWHLARGFNDVGYHYFIRKDGALLTGRPISKTPAAQKGHNRGTIAICCHGLKEEKFTDAQFVTLKNLCLAINNAYDGAVTFHGHREVAAKACPVYKYKEILSLDSFGNLGLTGAAEAVMFNNSTSKPTLKIGDRGAAVARVQALLLIKDDGIFGPKTGDAVRAFQRENGLDDDGIVGENTWDALLQNDKVDHID